MCEGEGGREGGGQLTHRRAVEGLHSRGGWLACLAYTNVLKRSSVKSDPFNCLHTPLPWLIVWRETRLYVAGVLGLVWLESHDLCGGNIGFIHRKSQGLCVRSQCLCQESQGLYGRSPLLWCCRSFLILCCKRVGDVFRTRRSCPCLLPCLVTG